MRKRIAVLLLAVLAAGCSSPDWSREDPGVQLRKFSRGVKNWLRTQRYPYGRHATADFEQVEERTWPANGIARLKVGGRNGEVRITAGPDSIVSARIRKTWSGADTVEARAALDRILVIAETARGELVIRAERPAGEHRGGVCFDRQTPPNTVLDLETSNGPIVIERMAGRIRALTSNGAIRAESTRALLEARTSNGQVTVIDHQGPVDAITSNGRIECEMLGLRPGEDVALRTSNGEILLYLSRNISARFEAITSNGQVRIVGLDSVRLSRDEEAGKAGTIRSGASRISAGTSNGGISIRAR